MQPASVARLTTSGMSAKGNAYSVGEDVAVRPEDATAQFWVGRIKEVGKARLLLQWFDHSKGGKYQLMEEESTNWVPMGSVLTKVCWKADGSITKASLTQIKKNL